MSEVTAHADVSRHTSPIAKYQPEDLINQFLQSHDVKETSRSGYRRRLRQFLRWCTDKNIHQPTRESILDYKRYLGEQKFSPISIAAYLTAIRCFFAWAESMKIYPNIAKSIKGPKKQRGFYRDPLTVSQVHRLLDSISRDTIHGKRDYALINILIRTGLRTIELVRANVEDVRQQSGETVLWVQGKGADAKDAFVVLTESTLRPLQEYLSARGSTKDGEPLFGSVSDGNRHKRMTTRSIRRIVKERLRGIKIDSPRITSHSLRHTAVTLALLGGSTLQETQQLARHADINTTLIYSHNLNRAAGVPEKNIDQLLSRS